MDRNRLEPEFVVDLLVVKIENIADKLVVEAQAIVEIGGLKSRIADLSAKFGFDRLYGVDKDPLLQMVADNKEVDPSFGVMKEYAGDEHELEGAAAGQLFYELLFGDRGRIDEEMLEGL